jgi:hypothetical protein
MAKEVLEIEVKSKIKPVTKDVENLGKTLEQVIKDSEKLGKELDNAGKKGKKGLKKISLGFKDILKGAGILALLGKAFEVFQEVLGKNQKVLDFFGIAMNTLSIAFNDLFKFLENNVGTVIGWFKELFDDPKQKLIDFGTAIKENIIERFESWLESIGFLASAVKKLFARDLKGAMEDVKNAGKEMVDVWTGVDDSVDKLGKKVTEGAKAIKKYALATVEQATALKDAEKAAGRAAVQFAKLNAQYLKEAEDQRQIRDNVNLTFEERIEANEKLDKVLEKQQKLQKASVQTQIDYLQAQYDINASEENFIALGTAQVEMLSLQEAINGQLSEQKTNQIGLENELKEAKSQSFLEGLSGIERELAELDAAHELKLDMARKANVDETEIIKQHEKERKKIIDDAARASAIQDEDASKVGLERLQGELDDEFAIRIEAAKKEQDLAKETAEKKKAVSQEMLSNLTSMLTSNLEAQGTRIEQEYNREIKLAEANGRDTEAIEEKFEGKRSELAKKQKKLKIGLATIDMYQSVVAAYNQGMGVPPPAGLILGPASAALALAAGLANINSIMKTDVGGGGGGGGAPASASASPPAPEMMSGAFELEGGQAVEPMQAYVVSDDITNNQNKLAIIRRRATI